MEPVIPKPPLKKAWPLMTPAERLVSNPNILFELGYAFGTLGPHAIVGVFNTAFGEVEELPFDLPPKRLTTYRRTYMHFPP